MIDASHAEEALALLSTAIADVIEEVHPVTVEVHVGGDRTREEVLVEAGKDILALVGAMQVLRRRMGSDRDPANAV